MESVHEEWKPVTGNVAGWPYEVSNTGKIRSHVRRIPRIRKTGKSRLGYVGLNLQWKKTKKYKSVHALVSEAFLGVKAEGLEVNHKNGIKEDNRVENLEFVTRSENVIHGFKLGLITRVCGESVHNAKLTESRVRIMREMRSKGATYGQLVSMFGISKPVVAKVLKRQAWRHVT